MVSAYIRDLGGIDRCSEIKLGLCRRLAAATVQSELYEARLINGEKVDPVVLCTLTSTCVRLAQRIGLERKVTSAGPTLSDMFKGSAS